MNMFSFRVSMMAADCMVAVVDFLADLPRYSVMRPTAPNLCHDLPHISPQRIPQQVSQLS